MEYYLTDGNPTREALDKVARSLGMEAGQVRAWFRNQRAKDRRKGNNRGNLNPTYNPSVASRVHAPPGGYPLPIVNKARSPGRLAKSASLPHDAAQLSINHAPGPAHLSTSLSSWEELWSNDFIPPNVDLHPDHLKNGEVVRLLDAPPHPPLPAPGHAAILPPHPSSGAQGHHSHQLQHNCAVVVPSNGMGNGNGSSGLGGGGGGGGASMAAWGT